MNTQLRNRIAMSASAGLIAVLALAIMAAPALGTATIKSFTTTSSVSQAGGHPDLTTSFTVASPGEPEAVRNVIFEAPEGLFGDTGAITKCTSSDFALERCPTSSQAGVISIYANYEGNPTAVLGTAPIYDLQVPSDRAASFGLIVPILGIPINIPVTVRTADDFGLRFTVSNVSQLAPLSGADMTFWGFPADPSHDAQRFAKGSPGSPAGCPGIATTACIPPASAEITVQPFTVNPSTCTGQPLLTKLRVQTYQDLEHFSESQSSYPATTGCEKQSFKPVLLGAPTSTETDSPSGLDIELRNPQFLGPAASPAQLRTATVALPEGLTINPDAADGQSACTDAQANFGSEEPTNCPDNAKIGTVSIDSPTLEGQLEGSVYIGEPKPDDQYRLFLTVGGFGINAKLVGSFKPDPLTGQVTAVFEDLPKVPFDSYSIHLFASDRGLVATPTHCTIYPLDGHFIPWNEAIPDVKASDTFGLNSGPGGTSCPGQVRDFKPRLAAGTSNSLAGGFSSFHLRLDRDDGDQYLGDLGFRMPPGLTASLRGISYCPETGIMAAAQNLGRAEQASSSCPASSQIGTTNVAAGPGSHPFNAVGKMYLAGPFKGAPLSLVAVTPALAGPYDYGVVVVRVAVRVDPLDAHVEAISDTVPAIIGGIPIRMRSIQVNIDRPEFMINPTNCTPTTVGSTGIGDQGTVTDFSSYFHADNCSGLNFKPKMTIRLPGSKKATRRAKNPQLQFDLRTRPGDANIKSLSVTLSSAFAIDQRHLGNICSEKELTEKQCAGRTPIGKAMTTTPLLDQPLEGPVFAVSGSGGLPKLAFILNGQVNLVPRAETKTIVTKGGAGKLQTTVPVVPDAPIGHFALTVFGGKTGYLVNTRSLCAKAPVTKVAYTGQNGKTYTENVKVKAACGVKSKRAKRHQR